MEIHRVPPLVSASDVSRQSSEAVAALHKALVTLRNELVNKNNTIARLEETLGKRQEKEEAESKKLAFEDIFVLQVGKQSTRSA